MSELLLLLPLKVLPGWPEPEPVSRLFLVVLCVLGPLTLGAVIAAIANAPRLMRRGREDNDAVGLGEPTALRERAELEHTASGTTNPRRAQAVEARGDHAIDA